MIKVLVQLRRPGVALCCAFGFLCVWLTLCAVAQFSSYSPSEGSIAWYNDFIGHWATVATLCAAVALYVSHTKIFKLAGNHLLDELNEWLDQVYPRWVMAAAIGCIVLAVLNALYVGSWSTRVHWTQELLPWALPSLIAAAYFVGVVLPLVCALMPYGRLLRILAARCDDVPGFDEDHQDRMFGLRDIGNTVIWTVLMILVTVLPLIVLQFIQKKEPTISNFVAAIIVLLLVARICLFPLWTMHLRLVQFKQHRLDVSRTRLKDLRRQISELEDRDDVQRLEAQHSIAREADEFATSLKTIPVSPLPVLFGSISLLVTGAGAVVGVIKAVVDVVSSVNAG